MSASCRVVRRHLDALVDGELDGNVQVDFETHLAGCPICREHAAFSKAVKRTVKQELGSAKAPEHLRLRVLTAIQSAPLPPGARTHEPAVPVAHDGGVHGGVHDGERERGPAPRVRVWMLPARYAVPAAAAAVLVIALGARTDDGEADEAAMVVGTTVPIFEDVVRRHSSEHPTEVQGPPQQVGHWFNGKLDFPVRPVMFERSDARLLGARISNVRDRDAAAFYYDVHGHRVTVIVFEPPSQPFYGVTTVNMHGRVVAYRQVRGYTVPVVQEDGLAYSFIGDLDSQSMLQLAASARVAH